MASDRARISFDPTRGYRAVVAQQGRVTLEADINEAASIENEALRLETIDLVGPAATPAAPPPGDGYKVIPGPTPGQTVIHEGVYYLGGWRLSLDAPVELDKQPDWLDRPADGQSQGGNDLVSLLITEQSVCAVEDQALREVALGGPDTAARMRLMQRFLLLPMQGDTCADGAALVGGLLAADGVTLDPYSYQLLSSATLQVGFVPDGAPPDPCTPTAAGGYLGADNQLIRVTVSAFDQQSKTGAMLWGWNNASFLYRADLTDKLAGVFTLRGAPIDQEHAPQLGQAVEILRIRADLVDSSGVPATNYVAADSGFVTTISQAYSFDDGTLTIADLLPPEYQSDPGPLFVRLWQAIVPFTAGEPTPLDTTSGIEVTIGMSALPANIAARPFWRFAVRPDTPVNVYPARYQDAPQPPDGPRQWLCDLGVIGQTPGAGYGLLADCRTKFPPTNDQGGGCCGLTLDPEGVAARGGLQAVVDSLAGGPAVLSLKAGEYILSRPLVLTGHHRRLTLEGCTLSVSIRPDPNNLRAFTFGLIVIEKTDAITLRRLEFDVPMVQEEASGTVVGVLIGEAGLVTIEDCAFGIRAPDEGRVGDGKGQTGRDQGQGGQGYDVIGGAVVLLGRVAELTIRRNRVVGKHIFYHGLVCGVFAGANSEQASATLEGVDISENYFERLNAGVFGYAHLGDVRCSGNRVRECFQGLVLADASQVANGAYAKQAIADTRTNPAFATLVRNGFQVDRMAASAQSKAAFFGAVKPAKPSAAPRTARNALMKSMTAKGLAAYKAAVVAPATRTAATDAPAKGPANAKPASGAAPAEAPVEGLDAYKANLDLVQNLALALAVNAPALVAALHIDGNDIHLVKTPEGVSIGVGISIYLSLDEDHGMVLMNGNRIVCPNTETSGAVIWFATAVSATGNLVMQPGPNLNAYQAPAFISVGEVSGHYAYAGNVFHAGAYIFPTRGVPAPTPDWPFFNDVT